MKENQILEKRAYNVSLTINFLMAALGFGFFILTDSKSILLDGMFSLLNMLIVFITLKVALLVRKKSTENFHYGFIQAEPLLNIAKGLMMILILVFANVTAIKAIQEGGNIIEFGTSVYYAIIAAVGCFVTALYLKKTNKKVDSSLLNVEAKSWMIDGIISLMVAIAFFVGSLLPESISAYTDPVAVITMSTFMILVPFKILYENGLNLMLAAPKKEQQDLVHKELKKLLSTYNMDEYDLRMIRPGNKLHIVATVFVEKGNQLTLISIDNIRQEIDAAIKKLFPNSSLFVDFTSDRKIFEEQ